jgi:hypothetical protein
MLCVRPTGSANALIAKERGALGSKNSEKCPENKKFKQTQSIKVNVMKSRANQQI